MSFLEWKAQMESAERAMWRAQMNARDRTGQGGEEDMRAIDTAIDVIDRSIRTHPQIEQTAMAALDAIALWRNCIALQEKHAAMLARIRVLEAELTDLTAEIGNHKVPNVNVGGAS